MLNNNEKLNIPELKIDHLHAELLRELRKTKDWGQENVKEVKEKYLSKFPDRQEETELVFGFLPFLETSRRLDNKSEIIDKKVLRDMYKDLTEFQFLITHFLLINSEKKEALENLWVVLEELSTLNKQGKKYHEIKKGVLSQVAVFKTFQKLGLSPSLSTPEEDAFDSIDLHFGDKGLIQIKSAYKPQVFETEFISRPGIETEGKKKSATFNSYDFYKAQKFKEKIKKYNKKKGKEHRAYIIFAPREMVDQITGEPDERLVEFVRSEIKDS